MEMAQDHGKYQALVLLNPGVDHQVRQPGSVSYLTESKVTEK
jgi:hypothetical protein